MGEQNNLMRVDPADVEAAIRRHVIMATRRATPKPEGSLYVKVVLHNGSDVDNDVRHGGLFLSVPYGGGDEQWLRTLMADVRDSFEGTDTLHVDVGTEEEISAFDDDEAGIRLLNVLSLLTITHR